MRYLRGVIEDPGEEDDGDDMVSLTILPSLKQFWKET
jgi:hypothetical protein